MVFLSVVKEVTLARSEDTSARSEDTRRGRRNKTKLQPNLVEVKLWLG